jgi:hypothetical protein
MSHVGQTEKNSLRANVFRVTPESGHCSMQSACLKGATGHGWRGPATTIITGAKILDFIDRTGLARGRIKS